MPPRSVQRRLDVARLYLRVAEGREKQGRRGNETEPAADGELVFNVEVGARVGTCQRRN